MYTPPEKTNGKTHEKKNGTPQKTQCFSHPSPTLSEPPAVTVKFLKVGRQIFEATVNISGGVPSKKRRLPSILLRWTVRFVKAPSKCQRGFWFSGLTSGVVLVLAFELVFLVSHMSP